MKIQTIKAWMLGFWILMLVSKLSQGVADERGIASWYSRNEPGVGRRTASGEFFNDALATCASWRFPLGTYIKITNPKNGKSVVCRVNDRGPRLNLNRRVDLTKSSFKKIADPDLGLVQVVIHPLGR